jgi:hypothetical protein
MRTTTCTLESILLASFQQCDPALGRLPACLPPSWPASWRRASRASRASRLRLPALHGGRRERTFVSPCGRLAAFRAPAPAPSLRLPRARRCGKTGRPADDTRPAPPRRGGRALLPPPPIQNRPPALPRRRRPPPPGHSWHAAPRLVPGAAARCPRRRWAPAQPTALLARPSAELDFNQNLRIRIRRDGASCRAAARAWLLLLARSARGKSTLARLRVTQRIRRRSSPEASW